MYMIKTIFSTILSTFLLTFPMLAMGQTTGILNGHEWVDLGLKSGVKWATCNVGASSPSDFGDYYAWGEINTKDKYTQENYNGSNRLYDVANAKWGNGWSLPKRSDIESLISECSWEITKINGHNGFKVTGPNGNSIFFPAAGSNGDIPLYVTQNQECSYWSGTARGDHFAVALYKPINSNQSESIGAIWRYYGLPVRPVVEVPTTGTLNGHNWIDLGIGVKWATCNVGASSPSDYGNYYAWGEISTKSNYNRNNSDTYEREMQDIGTNPSYDVARAKWGSTWRLPTKEEMKNLKKKCKWEWTTQGGHKGMRVTGPNGNSIFLPAAGFRRKDTLFNVGENGDYWSSTPDEYNTNSSWRLDFDDEEDVYVLSYLRCTGFSVRPVTD